MYEWQVIAVNQQNSRVRERNEDKEAFLRGTASRRPDLADPFVFTDLKVVPVDYIPLNTLVSGKYSPIDKRYQNSAQDHEAKTSSQMVVL